MSGPLQLVGNTVHGRLGLDGSANAIVVIRYKCAGNWTGVCRRNTEEILLLFIEGWKLLYPPYWTASIRKEPQSYYVSASL